MVKELVYKVFLPTFFVLLLITHILLSVILVVCYFFLNSILLRDYVTFSLALTPISCRSHNTLLANARKPVSHVSCSRGKGISSGH